MDDLIRRQAAIDAFEDTTFTKNEIRRRLLELPSAQSERKKGKWIAVDKHFSRVYACSCCGEWRYHPEPYCGQCGADMRE